MKLLGYSNTWTARPGDRIDFMVSSEAATFEVEIVRLHQVDDRPVAPPYREEVVATDVAGRYPGRKQPLRAGSYLRVATHLLPETESFTFNAWIYPTVIGRGRQGICSRRNPATGTGFDFLISESGRLRFEVGPGGGQRAVIESSRAVDKGWHFVSAGYDASAGKAFVWHNARNAKAPHLSSTEDAWTASVEAHASFSSGADFLMAGLPAGAGEVQSCFNGKIGGPSLYERVLSNTELTALHAGAAEPSQGLAARWDFGAFPFGTSVPDRSARGSVATVVNNPMRAVTGPFWDGSVTHFQMDPRQYDAIHFHDDDLEDAKWAVDFSWLIPQGTPSGVYAARMRTEADEDYVPFVVRPLKASAATLFLLPTFSYLAYANERIHALPMLNWPLFSELPLRLSRQDEFSARTPELGCCVYDVHTDGTPACYSSLLRPVVNFRPKVTAYLNGAGNHFGADMYLLDWLERMGFEHELATDHDLHAEGAALLSPYKVVLLGQHPEYFSWEMRRALDEYVAGGGRLMYLGGNGCWHVTGVDSARPHVIEVRKIRALDTDVSSSYVLPGEEFLATTGQRGGTWRGVGRGPELLFGVGSTALGLCQARGYERQPDSFKSKVAFIFDGIADHEVIGEFGLAYGGAAGFEVDCVNPEAGTPRETYVLASSSNHPERFFMPLSREGLRSFDASKNAKSGLRADMTYYETPVGGAVFSVGSMCWLTSLPWNGYENNVARVTSNVLRRFLE